MYFYILIKMEKLNISFINDYKELLEYLNKLNKNEIIIIDEETIGTFLKDKNIVIIEYMSTNMYATSVYKLYQWDEYIEEVKKEIKEIQDDS